MRMKDGPRTKKTNSGNNLRRDPRVAVRSGNAHEQRRSDADHDVGAKAGRLVAKLTFDSDNAPEQRGNKQLNWN